VQTHETHHGVPLDPAAVAQQDRRPAGPWARKKIGQHLAAQAALAEQPEVLSRLVAIEDLLQQRRQVYGIPRKEVLFSGSAVFDSTGVWAKRADLSRSIFVTNLTVAQVTVLAGPRQQAVPGQGSGVWVVPAGCAHSFDTGETTEWSLYGTPGGLVNVMIFGRTIAPFASSLGATAVIGGTP
jgi:hypothetical protein